MRGNEGLDVTVIRPPRWHTDPVTCLQGCWVDMPVTRQRVRQHVRHTGHTVHVHRVTTTIYKPEPTPGGAE